MTSPSITNAPRSATSAEPDESPIDLLDANPELVRADVVLRITREPRSERDPDSGAMPEDSPEDLPEGEAKWVGRCRQLGAKKLHAWGLSSLAESAKLLISELVTNALRHGASTEIGIRLLITTDGVVIEVDDGSPGRPYVRMADPEEESGRGLFLVDFVAENWGVSPDGTKTWCALRAPAAMRGNR